MGDLSLNVHTTRLQSVCHAGGWFGKGQVDSKNAVTRALSDDFASAGRGLWRLVNVPRGVWAALVLVCAVAARAQDAGFEPPAPEVAMRAFHAVRGVLAEGEAVAITSVGESAACVVLRLDGRIIARGTGVGRDALAAAVTAAWDEIEAALDRAPDAVQQAAARQSLKRATLSLELGGQFAPFAAHTFSDVDGTLAPGVTGVAARRGEHVEAAFPSLAMVSGKTPADSLIGCITAVTGDAAAPLRGTVSGEAGALAEKHGLVYYQFAVTHLVQSSSTDQPRFVYRGGNVVPQGEINTASLRAFERGLAEHLLARIEMEPSRVVGMDSLWQMSGTYHPATGRNDPEKASMTEHAIAALALCEYAKGEPDRMQAAGATGAARGVLGSLVRTSDGSAALWDDPAACAAWILAARALAEADTTAIVGDAESIAKIDTCLNAAFTPEAGWAPGIAEQERGLIACALAAVAAADAGAAVKAEACVRAIYRDAPPARLVVQMPWLLRAELLLAGERPIAAAPALREYREIVWQHQVEGTERDDLRDMAGGIVFTSAANPYPTWTSVRPMATAAIMLGDDRLTDKGETLRHVSKLLAGLRFVRQLAIDDSMAYAVFEPRKAKHGVRAALWDSRQPIEATSMALMAVTETRLAMVKASARLAKVDAPAGGETVPQAVDAPK